MSRQILRNVRLLHRLSFRLMLAVGALTALLFGIVSAVTWTIHSRHLNQEVIRHAALLSETMLLSLRDAMLANRFSEVDSVVSRIQTQPGIERIRIYDKSGLVMISTDEAELGMQVSLANEQCIACHIEGTPKVVLANPERTYTYGNGGIPVLGMITPIVNEPDCSSASCHAHPEEKRVLGVLDVNLSLAQTQKSLREETFKFTLVSVFGCLLIVAATGFSLMYLVYRPIHDLTVGTRELSAGNLDYRLPEQETDEFNALTQSFNRMTEDLKAARDEVHEWNRTLEQRVQQKAHELEQAHEHMIQNEKMASLGKLAAVVAHEINNPLAGILTYIKLLRRMLKKNGDLDRTQAENYLSMSESETVRVGGIVKNLLAFSRPSRPDQHEADINVIIERSMQLVRHQLNLQDVEQVADLDQNLPKVRADGNQIQQAILAIMINSVEAMPEGGRIRVASRYDAETRTVRFCISDSGIGIADEDLQHLFEPFFTTKTEGKGVGLGLFVVYGIIRRHGGTIEVESHRNEGTTFIITLPQDGPGAGADEENPDHPTALLHGHDETTEAECRDALRRAEGLKLDDTTPDIG